MDAEADRNGASYRSEGVALLAAALLSIVFMLHHPTAHSANAADAVREIGRIGTAARVVHSVLIALLVVTTWGVVGLARKLGFDHATVRFGALAGLLGGAAMVAAATLSGLVVPSFAAGFVGAAPAQLDALVPALRLCHEVNQGFAQVGTVALSGALLLLSVALVRRSGAARVAGVYGLLQGVAIVAALATGTLTLEVDGMTAVIVAHGVWYGTVGVLLLNRKL